MCNITSTLAAQRRSLRQNRESAIDDLLTVGNDGRAFGKSLALKAVNPGLMITSRSVIMEITRTLALTVYANLLVVVTRKES